MRFSATNRYQFCCGVQPSYTRCADEVTAGCGSGAYSLYKDDSSDHVEAMLLVYCCSNRALCLNTIKWHGMWCVVEKAMSAR